LGVVRTAENSAKQRGASGGKLPLLTVCVAALMLGMMLPSRAQNYERVAPQAPPAASAPTLPVPPTPPAAPQGNAVIIADLKGLAFVPSPEAVQKAGVATPGISLGGIAMLEQPGFAPQVAPFLGQPLTFDKLGEITRAVVEFYRANNHPLVNVVVPEQDVQGGVVQIVVTEYRVGAITVEGNKWFTASQVAAGVDLQPGDTVDSNTLLGDLDTANANSFRHVDVVYQPGTAPGTTDIVLQTQDRLPLRVYGSYDNSGQPVVGRDRWSLGFNWGNAFWLDQLLSYQLTTSNDFWHHRASIPGQPSGPEFVSHALSWSAPLPWGNRLSIFGDYEQSVPKIGTGFGETGISGQASLRDTYALPRTQSFTQAVEIGYDFKTTNNNLDFGGTLVSANSVEVDQFPLGYSANLLDRFGSTGLTTTLVWSPGGLTDANTDAAFQPGIGQSGRFGAKASYLYFRGELDRLTQLPKDFSWALRFIGQLSDRNLLDTEQLSVGGPDLLRGYDPNTINGDDGIVVSDELRAPPFSPLGKALPGGLTDQAQLLAFWDYAALSPHEAVAGDFTDVGVHASSAGLGLRYTLATNLAVKLDYGWQLQRAPAAATLGQFGFISVTIGY
jgi:hemolysin activation/secretion protein